ncbi:MAG: transposase [Clostridium sp.]|nr:transposase [Prevotella sp.]MCM1428517.1 transposase [Clostridium sp.]
MISISAIPGIPPLAFIKGRTINGKAQAISQPTRLGYLISRVLKDLPRSFQELRILQYKIMPDHIHLLLHIQSPPNYHLGDLIRIFKQSCNARYQEILAKDFDFSFQGHIFYEGYNDRILSKRNRLQVLFNYIRDNPRRLYLRQSFPQYFRSRIILQTADMSLALFGNLLLLEHPNRQAVRFSRNFSPMELKANAGIWHETIRNGGVLVSPFIHKNEKEFLNEALANDGKLIIIRNNGFPQRWKPEKRFIDACSRGSILFVAPTEFNSRHTEISREACMRMNDTAKLICRLSKGEYSLHKKEILQFCNLQPR